MRGYRRGTRAFGLGGLSVMASVGVWAAGDSPGGRYEWQPPLILGFLACVVLRFAFRPRVRLAGGHLLLDEPGWRWVVPASVVTAVESEGFLVVQTPRRVLQPSAFAPSVIAYVLGNGELHRSAEAIRAWWTSQLGTVPPAD